MVKRKRTNSDLQVIIPKSKDRAIGTTLQTWSGRVKQFLSYMWHRRVDLDTNPVKCQE